MRVNVIDKVLVISESVYTCFDGFDLAVDHSEDDCVKDSP